MKSSFKVGSLVAAAFMYFVASQAFACGGNQCNDNSGYGSGSTITGLISGFGGFAAEAKGQNHGSGTITYQDTMAESGGFTKLDGQANVTTCDSGNCASKSEMKGEGNAFGRSYEFTSGTGGSSPTSVQGGSDLELGVQASIFKKNQN